MKSFLINFRHLAAFTAVFSLLLWAAAKMGEPALFDSEAVNIILPACVWVFIGSVVLRVIAGWCVPVDPPVRLDMTTEYPSDAQLHRESMEGLSNFNYDEDAPYPSDAYMDRGEDLDERSRYNPDTECPSDSRLLSEAYRDAAEQEEEEEKRKAKWDLSLPGWFRTDRGEVFSHGSRCSEGNDRFSESYWLAFDGETLSVSLHGSDFSDGAEVSFAGSDATGSRSARKWARRLQRSNGVLFPRQGAFLRLCRKLGWSPQALRVLGRIYR